MSQKFLIIVSFVLFAYSLLACVRGTDEIVTLWNFTENITNNNDKPESVAVDSQRNIIAVGWSRIDSNFQWEIRKLDEDGILLWKKTYDISPTGYDRARDVVVDHEDNIIVVGFDSNTTGYPDKLGGYEWRIMKFTPNGISLKNYTFDFSTGSDVATDVAIDSRGNITVVGYDVSKGNYQWRIMKFNSTLDHQWNTTANPSPGSDMAYGIAINKSNNNITVVGTDQNTTGYPDKLGGYEWRVMKFTPDGISLKNYTFDFSTGSDVAYDVAIDSRGNITVVGYDQTDSDYQWRIMKFNSTLDHQWNTTANPSSGIDRAYDVALDTKDNIIVVGFDSNTTGYPDKLGEYEWRLMKFTPDGISVFNYTKDLSIYKDMFTAVTIDPYNNIIPVGYDYYETSSSIDYQWRILKLTFCGNEIIDDTEECDYKATNPDAPCMTYQYCNNICRCQDLFNVWVQPSEMLFTISQKTPVNLYIRNTGNDTDTYSIEPINPNPALIEVDVSGSSPTKNVDYMSTELVRPWITVFATATSEDIEFKVTSLTNPAKYRYATLKVLQGLPISLHEFNFLGLITLMILVGIVYFIVKPK